jgi:hypothetical protein
MESETDINRIGKLARDREKGRLEKRLSLTVFRQSLGLT